jgi:hypothetical protein
MLISFHGSQYGDAEFDIETGRFCVRMPPPKDQEVGVTVEFGFPLIHPADINAATRMTIKRRNLILLPFHFKDHIFYSVAWMCPDCVHLASE